MGQEQDAEPVGLVERKEVATSACKYKIKFVMLPLSKKHKDIVSQHKPIVIAQSVQEHTKDVAAQVVVGPEDVAAPGGLVVGPEDVAAPGGLVVGPDAAPGGLVVGPDAAPGGLVVGQGQEDVTTQQMGFPPVPSYEYVVANRDEFTVAASSSEATENIVQGEPF